MQSLIRSSSVLLCAGVLAITCWPIQSASAQSQQCQPSWSSLGSGTNDEISAIVVHNGFLVVGGKFTTAGGEPANYIARWNGAQWQTLGGGLPEPVTSLAVYNGDLYAGTIDGGGVAGGGLNSTVARWNGTSWSAVGGGVFGSVHALAVYNNTLVATGTITDAGGVPVNRIAQWNGSQWQGLGSGLNNAGEALAVFNNDLFVTGLFQQAGGVPASRIARWDGVKWYALGSGLSDRGSALAVFNGRLIVGGAFQTAGGQAASRVAQWTGTQWLPMGTGMNNEVFSFGLYDGSLFAGGEFTMIGGQMAPYLARWNGTAWLPVGLGMNDPVYAIAPWDGSLIFGGIFTLANGATADRVAQWNNCILAAPIRAPVGLHPSGPVYQAQSTFEWEHVWSATWYQLWVNDSKGNIFNKWYTAQEVGFADGICSITPTLPAIQGEGKWWVRAWSASKGSSGWSAPLTFTPTCNPEWLPLGSGLGDFVEAMTVYNGALVVGGNFTTAGGQNANYIARWSGSQWAPLASGTDFRVLTLTVFNGELIAGGLFGTAGGQPAARIARWNGLQWQPVGTGMNISVSSQVTSLLVHQGQLIAGGYFTQAGGQNANNTARWNGSQWQPLGPGFDNGVLALATYNGDLYAGGTFTELGGGDGLAGPAVPMNFIARWDGTQWSPLGTGMNANVSALAVYQGSLIAGGLFTTAGGQAANRIARWNGTQWLPLGEGLDAEVVSLSVSDGYLIAAGWFQKAGNVAAPYIARWDGTQWSEMPGGGTDAVVLASQPQNGDFLIAGAFTNAGGEAAARIARLDGCLSFKPLVAPTGLDPGGSLQQKQPTYRWTAVPGATWYRLYVTDSTGVRIDTWYTAAQVGAQNGICQIKPSVTLANGNGNWWVRPWNTSQGYGPWSKGIAFKVGLEPPLLLEPSGQINTPQPTYRWAAVPYATWYQLYVKDSTGTKIQAWYTAAQVGAESGICEITPNVNLALGNGQWWVRSWSSPLGSSAWSPPLSFQRVP